jgi:SsrA-binding protein
MSKAAPTASVIKVIAQNRKASHEFVIHERMEAGLVLVGSEVKSLREGKSVIVDGWAQIEKGQGWLHGVQINEYPWANRFNHELKRVRKLLLHKAELQKLQIKTRERGFTLIPLSIYFKGPKVKVELGLCTHKKVHDKRQASREADDKREMDRAIKRGR